MIAIRDESPVDVPAREALLDRCFGPSRSQKTCERLREGRLPAEGLALVAERDGILVATVRLWHVQAGSGGPALMLGPIAVDPECQGMGLGARMMAIGLGRARSLGHGGVLLVGDAPYYARFGFGREMVAGLDLPGPYELERFLGFEFRPGALSEARGIVTATGRIDPAASLVSPLGLAVAA